MNRVILCEGTDDLTFLGYYLYKISNKKYYRFTKNPNKNFELKSIHSRRDRIEIYGNNSNDDLVYIWGVGGKDNFEEPIKSILNINNKLPEHRFVDIFLVSDRDKDDVNDVINKFLKIFRENEYDVILKNNTINKALYMVEDEKYLVHIIPIIIPFDEHGAIETVLMNGIAEQNEGKIIVEEAEKYVDKIKDNSNIVTYLKHERDKLKAKFSAVMAIINPDKSTETMNSILVSNEWEKLDEIRMHFGIIDKIINGEDTYV